MLYSPAAIHTDTMQHLPSEDEEGALRVVAAIDKPPLRRKSRVSEPAAEGRNQAGPGTDGLACSPFFR